MISQATVKNIGIAYFVSKQVTDWQQGSTTDGGAVTIRKLLLTGSAVVLAGDLAVDDFLLACAEQPVIFEVSSALFMVLSLASLSVWSHVSVKAVDWVCWKLLVQETMHSGSVPVGEASGPGIMFYQRSF